MLTREQLAALDEETLPAYGEQLVAMAHRALDLEDRQESEHNADQFDGDDPYTGREFVLFTRSDSTFASLRLDDIVGVFEGRSDVRAAGVMSATGKTLQVRGDAAEISMRISQGDIIDLQDAHLQELLSTTIENAEQLEQIIKDHKCEVRGTSHGRLELLIEGRPIQITAEVQDLLVAHVKDYQPYIATTNDPDDPPDN